MEEVDEQELHVERVAALDLGKAVLEACVRVPHEARPGRRMQHAYPGSAKFSYHWWEADFGWTVARTLERVGAVRVNRAGLIPRPQAVPGPAPHLSDVGATPHP
jgi:hypothetical protein